MLPLPQDIGDYTLDALIGSASAVRCTYQAKQKGTDRLVVLELVHEEQCSPEEIASFLEEVRNKTRASEQLPFLGTVFEAQQKDGYLFFTYQSVEGTPLEDVIAAQGTLPSELLLQLVHSIARSRMAFEELNIATLPVALSQFRLTPNGKIAMENTAIAGTFAPEAGLRDLMQTGVLMRPLITMGTPGATRLHTLFSWMAEGADGQMLTWPQVRELVETVQEQLGLLPHDSTYQIKSHAVSWKKYVVPASAVAVLALLVVLLVCNRPAHEPSAPQKPKPVLSLKDHTDVPVSLPDREGILLCDSHEVTIKAYQRFLDSLDRMPEQMRMKDFAHPDQPTGKTTYAPEHWNEMLNAAQHNGRWNGMALSMTSPVFNVDWWDAYAYAKWKGRRLPTREEWLAIEAVASPDGKADPYGPVEEYSNDLGANNLCGFASGVTEWTGSIEENPNQPMEPPQHVICGGNYVSPALNKTTYEPDPGQHSPTLGFRTVAEQKQQ